MEINSPVLETVPSHNYFPVASPTPVSRPLRWLLELQPDGTICYSSLQSQEVFAEGGPEIIGSNFFELPDVLGGITEFKRDFKGFVKGDKNRQMFRLTAGSDGSDDHVIVVLTRWFDTSGTGPSSVVVLMEIKRI